MKADVRIDADGTIVLVTPLSEGAVEWIAQNVYSEPWQWLGDSLAVEHRYAGELVAGMREDGLAVSTANCWFAA